MCVCTYICDVENVKPSKNEKSHSISILSSLSLSLSSLSLSLLLLTLPSLPLSHYPLLSLSLTVLSLLLSLLSLPLLSSLSLTLSRSLYIFRLPVIQKSRTKVTLYESFWL